MICECASHQPWRTAVSVPHLGWHVMNQEALELFKTDGTIAVPIEFVHHRRSDLAKKQTASVTSRTSAEHNDDGETVTEDGV